MQESNVTASANLLSRGLDTGVTKSATGWLTDSKEQSPCYDYSSPFCQEISRILLKPKIHYRVHKGPSPAPIPGHMNPFQIYFLNTQFHTISHLCLVFIIQVSEFLFPPPTCPMPRPFHHPWLDCPKGGTLIKLFSRKTQLRTAQTWLSISNILFRGMALKIGEGSRVM